MTYSINYSIVALERDLEAARQIRERFPDAQKDQQKFWVSASLKPNDCDHVQIGPNDVVRVGALVGGQMVAMPLTNVTTTAALLVGLKERDPELFRALTLFAAGAKT